MKSLSRQILLFMSMGGVIYLVLLLITALWKLLFFWLITYIGRTIMKNMTHIAPLYNALFKNKLFFEHVSVGKEIRAFNYCIQEQRLYQSWREAP